MATRAGGHGVGSDKSDIRPVVRRPRSGLSGIAIAGLALLAALILFLVLDSRRRALTAPAVRLPRLAATAPSAPPPLYIPLDTTALAPPALLVPAPPPAPNLPRPSFTPPPVAVQRQPTIVDQQPFVPAQPPPPARTASGPALVIDASAPQAGVPTEPPVEADGETGATASERSVLLDRARASTIANRSATVPQGTLIPAVLETGYDSTRPGLARALVQRDIRGFDGSQVLIPRGSRLIGEYGTAVEAGQRRAMIAWSRLIRPDGVTIAIASPAADRIGRGGVRASVDSHFLERFSGAILQSALDVGVNLAASAAGSPVIVALPGSLQGQGNASRPPEIKPTLTIPPATSISVFVARDLDFSDVGGR